LLEAYLFSELFGFEFYDTKQLAAGNFILQSAEYYSVSDKKVF